MWLLCPSPCFYYKGETSWPTSTAQEREDLISQQPASQLPLLSIGCLAQLRSVWYLLSPSYNWYPFLLFTWSDSCPDLCMAGSFLSFCSWLNVTSSKSCFSLCYIEEAPQSHPVTFPRFIYVILLATEYIFIIGWCVHSCSPLSPVEWKLWSRHGPWWHRPLYPTVSRMQEALSRYLRKGRLLSLPTWPGAGFLTSLNFRSLT